MKEYPKRLWNTLEKEFSKNNNIEFSTIKPGSHKLYQWECENHPETYLSSPASRFRGQGCPYCSHNKTLAGFNDLATKNPEALKEWDNQKNDLQPQEVQSQSSKKVWWICELKHSYQQIISKHVKGQGCPYCAGRKVLVGFNDICDKQLIVEWDAQKNIKSITEYTKGSNYNAWWKCEKNNHTFQATITNRIQRKDGCPYCSGRKFLQEFNDLQSQMPEILEEWLYEKNTGLNPESVHYKTMKKAWFKCSKCQHQWRTSIYNRSVRKTGCPECAYNITVSKGEKELRQFISQICGNDKVLINDRNIISPMEIDIVIPSLKIGIEYNGDYWHSEKKIQESKKMSAHDYHTMKRCRVNEQGYLLLTVWENDWKKKKDMVKNEIRTVMLSPYSLSQEDVPRLFQKTVSDIH